MTPERHGLEYVSTCGMTPERHCFEFFTLQNLKV